MQANNRITMAAGGAKRSQVPDQLRVPRPGDAHTDKRLTIQDVRRGLVGGG